MCFSWSLKGWNLCLYFKIQNLSVHSFSLCLFLGKLPQRSSLWALSLSLSAVNLSESAQGKMAPAQLAEIYVTAATALRTILGHHLSFLPVCISRCLLSACYQPVFKFLLNLSHFQTHKHTVAIRHVCHITNYFYLPPRVICWAVQKVWPTSQRPNQFPTACAGSSLLWVDSSFWVAIGRWSLRTQTRCTHLQETQVCQKYRNLFFSICFFLSVLSFYQFYAMWCV